MSDNAGGGLQSSGKFPKSDIAILFHQFFEKHAMGGQFPMSRRATLRLGLNRSCRAQFALPSYASGGG